MGQLAYWTIGFVTSEEKGQTLSIAYFSLHKMFKVNDGELPGSMPRRHSKVSVIVGENTDVQGGFHLEFLSISQVIQCWTEGRSSTAVAEDLRPTATAAEV